MLVIDDRQRWSWLVKLLTVPVGTSFMGKIGDLSGLWLRIYGGAVYLKDPMMTHSFGVDFRDQLPSTVSRECLREPTTEHALRTIDKYGGSVLGPDVYNYIPVEIRVTIVRELA